MFQQKVTTPMPFAPPFRETAADGLWSRLPSVELPERVHQLDHVILWQVRGRSQVRGRTTSVLLREGDAVWLPSGTPHTLGVGEDSITTPLFLSAAEHGRSHLAPFTIVRIAAPEKFYLLALWNSQSTIIQPDADLGHQVRAIIEHAAHRAELPMPRTAEAAAVARALTLDPSDNRRISEWAATVCVSGRSLERSFASETGMSFGQWRKACRMLLAARLLRSGETVQVVTSRAGYENPSSFARAFRAYHGIRPSDCGTESPAYSDQRPR